MTLKDFRRLDDPGEGTLGGGHRLIAPSRSRHAVASGTAGRADLVGADVGTRISREAPQIGRWRWSNCSVDGGAVGTGGAGVGAGFFS